jgi:hypothetical protein
MNSKILSKPGRAPASPRSVTIWSASRIGWPAPQSAMTNQNDPNNEKSEMRVMWIGSIAIVLLLLGAMGINMLGIQSTRSVETSSQLGTAPPK